MSESAMDKQFAELAAHAVLGYLYDHDMYMLAEQFCSDCPYLKAEASTYEQGGMPVNMLQKPLQQVMKEFIVMQSQLLQLVNLCSRVVVFPQTDSGIVLIDHLINVLQSSGTGSVLDAVVSSLPMYSEWADIQSPPTSQPTPPAVAAASDDVHNTTGSTYTTTTISSSSFSNDSLPWRDVLPKNTNDLSPSGRNVRCNSKPAGPTANAAERPPTINNATSAHVQKPSLGGERITATMSSAGKQSNVPRHGTGTVKSPARQINPPNHNLPVIVTLKASQETELIASTGVPPTVSDAATDPSTDTAVPSATLSGVACADAPRSNATPLDNPIVPGTVSSRSTSSRKRTHIRILDFGTPPFKRSSPSASSSAGRRPSPPPVASPSVRPPIPVLKLPPSTDVSVEEEQRPVPPAPAQSERPKPKKVPAKRRPKRLGMRKKSKRTNASTITNKLVAETILRSKTLTRKTLVPRPMEPPGMPGQPSASAPLQPSPSKNEPASTSKKYVWPNRATASSTVGQSCQHPHATKVPTATNNEVAVIRPSSSSPPRTLMPPGSPSCPVDPLTVYPMTPRFLTRPLQPLSMLSPLLGVLDMSGISQLKSASHSKPSDINTPGYPITPGCVTTPSPPPDAVTYYESRPVPPPDEREGVVQESEPHDSETPEPEREGDVSREPQLTLTAGSEEVTIQYQDGQCQLPPLRERDSEYDERLTSRIEIDNGQQVYQIAISPIINLFEHRSS